MIRMVTSSLTHTIPHIYAMHMFRMRLICADVEYEKKAHYSCSCHIYSMSNNNAKSHFRTCFLYILLCEPIFDRFFGANAGVELRAREDFWRFLLEGLMHQSSSVRKHCNYLLKR